MNSYLLEPKFADQRLFFETEKIGDNFLNELQDFLYQNKKRNSPSEYTFYFKTKEEKFLLNELLLKMVNTSVIVTDVNLQEPLEFELLRFPTGQVIHFKIKD